MLKTYTYSQLFLIGKASEKLFSNKEDIEGADVDFNDMSGKEYMDYLKSTGL